MGSMESRKGSELTYCECLIAGQSNRRCKDCRLYFAPDNHPLFYMARIEIGVGCCWWWTGKINKRQGYGIANNAMAHRSFYKVIVNADLSDDLVLDHLCRNTLCVNPDHLEPVTQRENLMRGATVSARAAKATHCPQGHPYDEENTITKKNGDRGCKACTYPKNSQWHKNNREKANVSKRKSRAKFRAIKLLEKDAVIYITLPSNCKFTAAQIQIIRKLRVFDGYSTIWFQNRFGVSETTVLDIFNRKAYKKVPDFIELDADYIIC